MSRQQVYWLIIALGIGYGLLRVALNLRGGGETSTPPTATVTPKAAKAEMVNTAAPPLQRAQAIDLVAAERKPDSMPELIRLLDDPDPLVRARAGVAVTQILQADFYFRADDPPNIRSEAVTRIRNHWEAWKAKGLPGAK